MREPRSPRRSFLAGSMSALAGAWVLGAETLSAIVASATASGCDPRVKYGGPPPELFLDASGPGAGASESASTTAPTASSPSLSASGNGSADPSLPAVASSAMPPAPVPTPAGPPKYGGPPRPKYGGPPPQPRKYGGDPSDFGL